MREISWELERLDSPPEKLKAQWSGLLWLLQKSARGAGLLPDLAGLPLQTTKGHWTRARELSDKLAQEAAGTEWLAGNTWKQLTALAATDQDFLEPSVPQTIQARRAERLVLALDRLVASLERDGKTLSADTELNQLFKAAQSVPDFNPVEFSKLLPTFAKKIKAADSGNWR